MSQQLIHETMIEVSKIQPPLFQCRTTSLEENLEELTESIKAVGLLQPLTVRIDKAGNTELVFGSRRLAACKKAGLKNIPVIIKELSDEEALEIESSENLNRNDLTNEEKIRLVAEWAKRGYDAKTIAEKLHKSYTWVMLYLPSQYKDQTRAAAGKLGGEVKQQHFATTIVAKPEQPQPKPKVVCPECGQQFDSEFEFSLLHWRKRHSGPPPKLGAQAPQPVTAPTPPTEPPPQPKEETTKPEPEEEPTEPEEEEAPPQEQEEPLPPDTPVCPICGATCDPQEYKEIKKAAATKYGKQIQTLLFQ